MRTFLPLFVILPIISFAQDNSWMKDITQQVGLGDIVCFRPHVIDLNNDGYQDLLILNDSTIFVYLNQDNGTGGRHFVDFTTESAINQNPRYPNALHRRVMNLSMADIDNDGDPDLISCNYYHRLKNYSDNGDFCDCLINDGNAHFEWKEASGITEMGMVNSTGVTFLDYNLDGLLDVYIATWSVDHDKNDFDYDRILKGNGDATFTNTTKETGIDQVEFPMYGVNVADWNNDGWPDVLTSPYCRSGGSLWKNNADGTFSDVAKEVGYNAQTMAGDKDGLLGPGIGRELCQWGAEPMDFDQDGDLDLYLILVHGGMDAGEGRSTIVINKGKEEGYKLEWALDRVERDKWVSDHHGDRYVSWFDLDNDGWMDMVGTQNVYRPNTDRIYFWRQNETHYFDDITYELGLAREVRSTGGLMAFDYDNDGDDDVLVAHGNNKNALMLIENRIGNKNNHISVELVAPPGVNKSCVGARVIVYAQDYMQIREVYAGQGNFTTLAPFILNYGLGQRTAVDSIVVRWPRADLPTTTVVNPPIN
ncbi:MAG: CRTAC1 family protein, partial [Bacteroidetes bacterium]|nr:CRTAC1 family protein [Bacteroidota bacterium]